MSLLVLIFALNYLQKIITMSYCAAIEGMQPESRRELHKRYHDKHYGFPIHDDNELFGRLVMEINQAGLSWETILKKKKVSERRMMILTFRKWLLTVNLTVKDC